MRNVWDCSPAHIAETYTYQSAHSLTIHCLHDEKSPKNITHALTSVLRHAAHTGMTDSGIKAMLKCGFTVCYTQMFHPRHKGKH